MGWGRAGDVFHVEHSGRASPRFTSLWRRFENARRAGAQRSRERQAPARRVKRGATHFYLRLGGYMSGCLRLCHRTSFLHGAGCEEADSEPCLEGCGLRAKCGNRGQRTRPAGSKLSCRALIRLRRLAALKGHRIPAQGANPGNTPGKTNPRSEGTPHIHRVSEIDPRPSYAVFLQNTPFLSDAVPRAMLWAGMRCAFSAKGRMRRGATHFELRLGGDKSGRLRWGDFFRSWERFTLFRTPACDPQGNIMFIRRHLDFTDRAALQLLLR